MDFRWWDFELRSFPEREDAREGEGELEHRVYWWCCTLCSLRYPYVEIWHASTNSRSHQCSKTTTVKQLYPRYHEINAVHASPRPQRLSGLGARLLGYQPQVSMTHPANKPNKPNTHLSSSTTPKYTHQKYIHPSKCISP